MYILTENITGKNITLMNSNPLVRLINQQNMMRITLGATCYVFAYMIFDRNSPMGSALEYEANVQYIVLVSSLHVGHYLECFFYETQNLTTVGQHDLRIKALYKGIIYLLSMVYISQAVVKHMHKFKELREKISF